MNKRFFNVYRLDKDGEVSERAICDLRYSGIRVSTADTRYWYRDLSELVIEGWVLEHSERKIGLISYENTDSSFNK